MCFWAASFITLASTTCFSFRVLLTWLRSSCLRQSSLDKKGQFHTDIIPGFLIKWCANWSFFRTCNISFFFSLWDLRKNDESVQIHAARQRDYTFLNSRRCHCGTSRRWFPVHIHHRTCICYHTLALALVSALFIHLYWAWNPFCEPYDSCTRKKTCGTKFLFESKIHELLVNGTCEQTQTEKDAIMPWRHVEEGLWIRMIFHALHCPIHCFLFL